MRCTLFGGVGDEFFQVEVSAELADKFRDMRHALGCSTYQLLREIHGTVYSGPLEEFHVAHYIAYLEQFIVPQGGSCRVRQESRGKR